MREGLRRPRGGRAGTTVAGRAAALQRHRNPGGVGSTAARRSHGWGVAARPSPRVSPAGACLIREGTRTQRGPPAECSSIVAVQWPWRAFSLTLQRGSRRGPSPRCGDSGAPVAGSVSGRPAGQPSSSPGRLDHKETRLRDAPRGGPVAKAEETGERRAEGRRPRTGGGRGTSADREAGLGTAGLRGASGPRGPCSVRATGVPPGAALAAQTPTHTDLHGEGRAACPSHVQVTRLPTTGRCGDSFCGLHRKLFFNEDL